MEASPAPERAIGHSIEGQAVNMVWQSHIAGFKRARHFLLPYFGITSLQCLVLFGDHYVFENVFLARLPQVRSSQANPSDPWDFKITLPDPTRPVRNQTFADPTRPVP